MRHLFLPACLCLMTLPGATGQEPKLPLDSSASVSTVNKNATAGAAVAETTRDLDSQAAAIGESARATEIASQIEEHDAAFDPGAALDSDDEARPAEILPARAPRLPPKPKPVIERTREEICDTLTQAAQRNDVPTPFFIRLLFQESRFKPGVISSAGAEGIAQFMPETSASVGLDNPFDPLQAIPAAARLLRSLTQQFGNLGLAAAAYNAGPHRIQDWLSRKGKLPQETQGYVRVITGRAPETWTAAANGSPALKLPRHAPCQEAAGLLAWDGPERIPLPPVPGGKKVEARIASVPDTVPKHIAVTVAAAHDKTPAKAKVQLASADATALPKAAPDKMKAAPEKTAAKAAPKKAVLAQVAAAKHKHAHKGQKIARN